MAVLADMHGNADALRAALADVARRGPDAVVVNGDVVNRGPDSVECLALLLSLRPTPLLLQGNHDDLMWLWWSRDAALPGAWFGDPFWRATAWSAARLEEAGLLGELRGWPLLRDLCVPGLPPVRLAHGTPAHYRESLGRYTPAERLRELLPGAGVLVGSHTHIPFAASQRRGDGVALFVNTGAVGVPFNDDPRAQYLLLDARPGKDGSLHWHPEFVAVPYDRRPVLARFETSGLLLRGGLSARIFREEIARARSLYTPFFLWATGEGVPMDEKRWRQFRALFPERFVSREPVAVD